MSRKSSCVTRSHRAQPATAFPSLSSCLTDAAAAALPLQSHLLRADARRLLVGAWWSNGSWVWGVLCLPLSWHRTSALLKSSGSSRLKTGITDALGEHKLGWHLARGRGVLYGVNRCLWQGGGLCLPTESGAALSILWWESTQAWLLQLSSWLSAHLTCDNRCVQLPNNHIVSLASNSMSLSQPAHRRCLRHVSKHKTP